MNVKVNNRRLSWSIYIASWEILSHYHRALLLFSSLLVSSWLGLNLKSFWCLLSSAPFLLFPFWQMQFNFCWYEKDLKQDERILSPPITLIWISAQYSLKHLKIYILSIGVRITELTQVLFAETLYKSNIIQEGFRNQKIIRCKVRAMYWLLTLDSKFTLIAFVVSEINCTWQQLVR